MSVVPPVATPKSQAATQPRETKNHRTSLGDRCEGAIWIPGLG
ncbi:MAG: hypothetical protein AAGG53_03665 [Cyanobacteria bacterium P01_H01_bin.152]